MKFKLALISGDQKSLTQFLHNSDSFELIANTDNGTDGIRIINELMPDVAICDLVLKGTDGLTLLEKVKGTNTKIVIYSAFDSDDVIRSACLKGAALYLVKPLTPETLAARLIDLLKNQTPENNNTQLTAFSAAEEVRISNVFLSAGIPPHIKGYGFLRTGVQLAMHNPAILGNITKQLYPLIAENYNTSASKVERGIRHAIEVAWNRGRIENLNSIFGVSFYSSGDKPTNGEFIALIADRLIQEMHLGKLG